MTIIKHLTTAVLSCAVASLAAGVAYAEANYCVAVSGGFGSGGTTFIGKGFSVPAAGNCTPWSGFTKTASTDPSWFGAGGSGSDYIQFCPKGVSGCPLGSGEDLGAFTGTAAPETCTTSLENLPAIHD
jgi:hypothetical protein